jgi:hypothetical protein
LLALKLATFVEVTEARNDPHGGANLRCWRDYLLPGLGVPPRLLFAALRKKSSPAIAPNLEQGKRKLARVPVDL